MLTFENAFQGSIAAGGGNMPSANATENDVVFGGIKTLDSLIKSPLKIYEGDLFVVLTGCTGELIGDNVPDLVRSYQEAGVTGHTVAKHLRERLGFLPKGDVFPIGALPRNEGKAKRVIKVKKD